jgi:hypothetical protein
LCYDVSSFTKLVCLFQTLSSALWHWTTLIDLQTILSCRGFLTCWATWSSGFGFKPIQSVSNWTWWSCQPCLSLHLGAIATVSNWTWWSCWSCLRICACVAIAAVSKWTSFEIVFCFWITALWTWSFLQCLYLVGLGDVLCHGSLPWERSLLGSLPLEPDCGVWFFTAYRKVFQWLPW